MRCRRCVTRRGEAFRSPLGCDRRCRRRSVHPCRVGDELGPLRLVEVVRRRDVGRPVGVEDHDVAGGHFDRLRLDDDVVEHSEQGAGRADRGRPGLRDVNGERVACARNRDGDRVAGPLNAGVGTREERVRAGPSHGAVERSENCLGSVAVPCAVADRVARQSGQRRCGRAGAAHVAEHDGNTAVLVQGEHVVEVSADLGRFSVRPVAHCGVEAGNLGERCREQAALQRLGDLVLPLM